MACPPQLKAIAHYVKIANEHSTRDPAVYYWCMMYAVQTGMSIDKSDPACIQYLSTLLGKLEAVKKQNQENEAIHTELVGCAHIETAGLRFFVWADQQDRGGSFDKNVVKAFYTAGHLFDVLELFGEVDEKLQEQRKYAKWKAAYIHNCLKNGEVPVPGPLGGEDEGDVNLNVPGEGGAAPSVPKTPDFNQPNAFPQNDQFKPDNTPSVDATSAAAGGETGAGSSRAVVADFVAAQKFCRYAASALEYEDRESAIDNLRKALNLLEMGK